ncbi:hypothetical protein ACRWQL_00845 (plasmid) [Shewanella sp. HL-SH4]|uniref:hypothetical protein n=1 Tax=Shewanella sp. HL-SH4 TaxID=3436240 RepID=UPI003EC06CE0
MKLSQLTGVSSLIEINSYSKSIKECRVTVSDDIINELKARFKKNKWQSIIQMPNGFTFFGKKKKDLGCDSLTIAVIGDTYVRHTLAFSNSSNTEVTYFKIIH